MSSHAKYYIKVRATFAKNWKKILQQCSLHPLIFYAASWWQGQGRKFAHAFVFCAEEQDLVWVLQVFQILQQLFLGELPASIAPLASSNLAAQQLLESGTDREQEKLALRDYGTGGRTPSAVIVSRRRC